jgi:hypothetical protein
MLQLVGRTLAAGVNYHLDDHAEPRKHRRAEVFEPHTVTSYLRIISL